MSRRVLVAAEVGLTLVTLTVAAGFTRLFTGSGFLPRLALVTVVAHGLSALWRRRGWSPWLGIGAQLVAAVVVLSWLYLGDTLFFGLPTASTAAAARGQLADAFAPFGDLVAPVPLTAGFALTMALTIWVIATFADAAAFGGRAPLQALIPHVGVVVATSLFARGRGAVAAGAWFVAASLFYLAAYRAWRESERRWVGDEAARGGSRLVALGALTAVGVGMAAAWLAPALPGATSPAALDLRALGRGAGPLEVGNPLVGVTNLLGPQSDQVVFRVTSDQPHYWRLTALEQFDGADQQWKTRRAYKEVDAAAPLPTERPGDVPVVTSDVRFQLTALGGVWLPAVLEPTAVDAPFDVRYDAESASLITARQGDLDRADYTVRASVPALDPAEIADRAGVDSSVGTTYLDDSEISPVVIARARQVTAGARTRLEQALALQDYLRDFRYRADVDYSTAVDPTATFLERRVGFCQQFASTFAQMARAVGIPSRVAVGFTSGDPEVDPGGGTATAAAEAGPVTYVVRGRNAHAWPELMIPGVGWTAFEPTPTRGNPDAEAYTGVPPQQAPPSTGDAAVPSTTVADERPPTPTVGPGGDVATEDPSGANTATTAGARTPGLLPVTLGLAVVVAVVLAGRAGWTAMARRRRRGPRDTPAGRVRAAWIESCDWLELLSVRREPAETPLEFADRVARRAEVDELALLARLETERLYSDSGLDEADAEQAEAVAAGVRGTLAERIDLRRRMVTRLGWSRRN